MTKINTPEGPRWVGMYRGKVLKTDKAESSKLGRIKAYVPVIHGDQEPDADSIPWAWPCFSLPGGTDDGGWGFISMPKGKLEDPDAEDNYVCIFFDGGDINSPSWMGGYYPDGKFPSRARRGMGGEEYPKVHMLRFPGKMMMRYTEDGGFEFFLGETADGEHGEYDTSIRMDHQRQRITVSSRKYPIFFRSDKKIQFRAPELEFRANKLEAVEGEPAPVSPRMTFSVSDSSTDPPQGTRISMTQQVIKAAGRFIRGFRR